MTQKDVERALNGRLNEYLAEYPIKVAYYNTEFDPKVRDPYLKVDVLHGETTQVELGTESANRAVGIYQITVNVKNNKGINESSQIIQQIKNYFKRGTVASYNGLNVRVTQFYLGSYFSEGDWFREVVNIVFRSDIDN